MVFSLFVEGEFFFLSHRSFGLRTYGLREVRKWIPNKITYNISITSLNERFSIYMFSTVCFIKPYRNMVYKCHPFTFLSPPLYFSQSPLYFPQSPLSFSCGRTYSKQLPWPCDPSLPSIRYDDEFRSQAFSLQLVYREGASSIPTAVVYTGWRTALQVLLSAHLAPSSTYPTHQATQSCQSQDTLLTLPLPEKGGATTAGSRRRRPSSWSWRQSSRSWRPSSWSGDIFQGAG